MTWLQVTFATISHAWLRLESNASEVVNRHNRTLITLHSFESLEMPLFLKIVGFPIRSLRDQYRVILQELGVIVDSEFKLQEHFGKRISILNQSIGGSGFIFTSSVPLGDAVDKLRRFEVDLHRHEKLRKLQHAAKIPRAHSKICKLQMKDQLSCDISVGAASKIVPNSVLNFPATLLCDKTNKLQKLL